MRLLIELHRFDHPQSRSHHQCKKDKQEVDVNLLKDHPIAAIKTVGVQNCESQNDQPSCRIVIDYFCSKYLSGSHRGLDPNLGSGYPKGLSG